MIASCADGTDTCRILPLAPWPSWDAEQQS